MPDSRTAKNKKCPIQQAGPGFFLKWVRFGFRKTPRFWMDFRWKSQNFGISIFRASRETEAINTFDHTVHINILHINSYTSTHQHITHQHINTSTHQHINTSTHQHINTSTHQHINTSTHQHINTSTHQHINWTLNTAIQAFISIFNFGEIRRPQPTHHPPPTHTPPHTPTPPQKHTKLFFSRFDKLSKSLIFNSCKLMCWVSTC